MLKNESLKRQSEAGILSKNHTTVTAISCLGGSKRKLGETYVLEKST
jgi:hypothetical protein